jgi:hypothetical protein
MAVDSRHKRAAAVALLLPFMFTANTDATLGVDAAERSAATWVYSGISVAAPAVSNRKLSFNLRNGSLSIGLANDQVVTSGASPTFDGANITGIDADNVDIADAGVIITATNVEDALQENRTAIDLNTTHAGSVGTDHGYIDQDLQTTASPQFVGLTTSGGRIKNTTRYTTTQAIPVTDNIAFCNTDGGAWTATLPVGAEGQALKIINCGANTLTVDPNGSEELFGAGAGVVSTLEQGEVIDIHYNATEGWY